MVLLGVLVTQTDSGQGCGRSWPLCHGQLLPDTFTISGLYEYSHRIMSSIDGFLVLVLVVATWLMYRHDGKAKLLSFLSIFFIVLQGALGALTVAFEGTFALSAMVSLHFGFALISFASVILLTIYLFQMKERQQASQPQANKVAPVSKGLQYGIWAITLYTYLVVYTGALVSHTGAVTGCGLQFPGCTSYVPNFTSLAGIQMLHRYAASSVWLFILVFLILAIRGCKGRRDMIAGSWWAFILVSLQAASGLVTLFTDDQLIAAVAHTTIISLLFCVLAYLCMQAGWPWQRGEVQQSEQQIVAPASLETAQK